MDRVHRMAAGARGVRRGSVKVFFDGGCRPNPGAIQTAVVAAGQTRHRTDHGHGDNSDAEWLALIEALSVARQLGVRDLILIGDSTLVVAQASGSARRVAPRFAAYLATFSRTRRRGFDRVRVRLCPSRAEPGRNRA
jgi:ribonuclease HI